MTRSQTRDTAQTFEATGLPPVPTGLRARAAGRVARALFRRAVANLAVRVEFPDGTVLGAGDSDAILPRMIVRDETAFFRRIGRDKLIGFGEAYMAGEWSSTDPAAVLTVFAERLATLVPPTLQRVRGMFDIAPPDSDAGHDADTQSNIAAHYDLSNAMFQLFLDPTLTYSSALFADPEQASWDGLEAAQHRKIDRLLDAAGVTDGSRVLEIGTGWGELCVRAAERGATVRSITLSVEQQELARARVADAGYGERVAIDLLDYRAVEGEYDAIVSVEMIEAVGFRYWDTYFGTLARVLAEDGRIAIQGITMPHDRMLATRKTYTWIQKYIFPGGFLPSVEAIETSAGRAELRVDERFSMAAHYAETLRLWRERFDAHADRAAALGFDEIFRRMWRLYLAYSEAGFRARYLDVSQFVLRKDLP